MRIWRICLFRKKETHVLPNFKIYIVVKPKNENTKTYIVGATIEDRKINMKVELMFLM